MKCMDQLYFRNDMINCLWQRWSMIKTVVRPEVVYSVMCSDIIIMIIIRICASSSSLSSSSSSSSSSSTSSSSSSAAAAYHPHLTILTFPKSFVNNYGHSGIDLTDILVRLPPLYGTTRSSAVIERHVIFILANTVYVDTMYTFE